MALYERLLGFTATGGSLPEGTTKIPPHAFVGMMAERRRGQVTTPQVIAAFGLTPSEQTEVATLVQRMQGGAGLTREELEDVLYVAETRRAPYDTVTAVIVRLGV